MEEQLYTENLAGLSVNELISPKRYATYINTELATNEPMYGLSYLPHKRRFSLVDEWLTYDEGYPQVIRLGADDVVPPVRSREGFEKFMVEYSQFSEGYLLTSDEKRKIVQVSQSGEEQAIRELMDKLYDDARKLVLGGVATLERNAIQVLTTGRLMLSNTGQQSTLDYHFEDYQRVVPDTPWTDSDADILKDINKWQKVIQRKTGTKPNGMLVGQDLFDFIVEHDSIQKYFNDETTSVLVSDEDVIALMQRRLGLTVRINTNIYKNEDGDDTCYMPDNTLVLLPDKELGYSGVGITIEEINGYFDGAKADPNSYEIVNDGFALSIRAKADTNQHEIRIAFTTIPVLIDSKSIMICTIDTGVETDD